MADVTDKNRLRQIQQQDLSESRLNDDFVFWLKTKGMNWLLVVLVALCGYSLLNYYWQRKDAARDNAWAQYTAARTSNLPESFASVATDHKGTDSVALLAWLAAGDAHLSDLQVGVTAPDVATNPDGTINLPVPLTAETKKATQDAADGFYVKVLEAIGSSKTEIAKKPMAIAALFGRAAVSESRGQFDVAKGFLTEIETLAQDQFPAFAREAKSRSASIDALSKIAALPSRDALPKRPEMTPLAPSFIDELNRSMSPATAPTPSPITIERGSGPPPSNLQPLPAPVNPNNPLDARPSKPATGPATPPATGPGSNPG
jgi:hypothetical protein